MKKILILIFCFILFLGCDNPLKKSTFGYGDQVIVKATGEKGKVVGSSRKSGEYKVRLPSGDKWLNDYDIEVENQRKEK